MLPVVKGKIMSTNKLKLNRFIAVMLLAIAAILGTLSNAQGSVILQEDFETDFSIWFTSGDPTIVSTPPSVNGSHIAQLPIDNSAYIQYGFAPSSAVTLDFFFQIDTVNATAGAMIKITEIVDDQTSSPITRLFLSCNGTGDLGWRLVGYGSAMDVFIPEGITQGVWYRITETIQTGATNGACQLWIDSKLVYSGSNLALPYATKAINLGSLLNPGYTTGNVYLDTVTMSDTLDPFPTPTPAPTETPTPSTDATATPEPTTVALTATPAPTSTPTIAPTTQSPFSDLTLLAVSIAVVVIVVFVLVVIMRKRRSGTGLPPPPPPPT